MIKVSIDTSGLEKKLKALTKDVKDGSKEYIDELARNSTAMMARRVQPYGVSNSQKEILLKAVYKDVNKVYKNSPRIYNKLKKDVSLGVASAYMDNIHNGNLSKAEEIAKKYIDDFESFISSDTNGNALNEHRSRSTGRVEKETTVVLATDSQLTDIKVKMSSNIGLAKAAFLEASKQLGRKTAVPRWLRHDGLATTRKQVMFGRYTVYVTNEVKYASAVITQSEITRCIRKAASNQLRVLNKKFDKYSK